MNSRAVEARPKNHNRKCGTKRGRMWPERDAKMQHNWIAPGGNSAYRNFITQQVLQTVSSSTRRLSSRIHCSLFQICITNNVFFWGFPRIENILLAESKKAQN